MRLVALGVVGTDDDVEEVADAGAREDALDRAPALRRDDAEPASFRLQRSSTLTTPSKHASSEYCGSLCSR
jgi:hypothetical protein